MTASGIAARPANDPPHGPSIGMAIPSWLVSLLFHAGILAALAVTFRQPKLIGNPNADPREAGIYFESGGTDGLPGLPGGGTGDSPAIIAAPAAEGAGGAGSSFDDLKVEETPPVELDLPKVSALRIRPGAGLPVDVSTRDARQMIKSSGAATGKGGGRSFGSGSADGGSGGGTGGGTGGGVGTGNGGNGGKGTSFFGQRAAGARFLYLLDASGSMQDYNALAVAKAELLASLAQLDAEQQFQVIFYSESCYPMAPPDGRSPFFAATDVNRTKASQFVRGISPLEGTRHLEALLTAMNYKPDVIFFLTDAGEPRLSAGDLDQIRKRNGEKSQIHTVEFGKHANLNINIDSNFLKRLARENRGGYVYRDITQFRKE